jgi:hypothetical protein
MKLKYKIVISLAAVTLLAAACNKTNSTTPAASNTPKQTSPVAYTDAPSFSRSFLQCSPSELKMPFSGSSTFVITVFGVENGKCHYTGQVVDQKGVAVQGGPPASDCKVPIALINSDVFGHLFGSDKTPAVKVAQDKLQTDYCIQK